jgi:hypothetical protein
MSDYIDVPIKKAMFVYKDFPCVRINSKFIRQAYAQNKLLKITCDGHAIYMTAEECKKKWKKVKEVFLFPNNPMVMYEGYVIDNEPPVKHEVNMENYLENMSRLSAIFKSKIKKEGSLNN